MLVGRTMDSVYLTALQFTSSTNRKHRDLLRQDALVCQTVCLGLNGWTKIWKYFSIRSFHHSSLESKKNSKINKMSCRKLAVIFYHTTTQKSHTTLLIKHFWDLSYSWCFSWTLFSVICHLSAHFAKNKTDVLSLTCTNRILFSLKQ